MRSSTLTVVAVCLAAGLSAETVSLGADDRPAADLHKRIETAFVRCDVKEMRGAFSLRVKTYVSSSLLGIKDGYYGADQMILFFQRLFKGRTTVRFDVLTEFPRIRKDGQAILPARWIYRQEGSSPSEARIVFVMAPESQGWRIREFRDLK